MSDDAEIVKAVAEGTMNGIMEPFKDLLGLLFRPVAGEIGEDLRDRYVTFRRTRTERLLTRTRQFIDERISDPQPVPPKLLAAIIENGTLEEDDYLQDRWATLLAHSSEKRGTDRDLLPSAVEILKQINRWEVLLLTNCDAWLTMDDVCPVPHPENRSQLPVIRDWQNHLRFELGFDGPSMRAQFDTSLMLENLLRLGLLRQNSPGPNGERDIVLTYLGYSFIMLCGSPLTVRASDSVPSEPPDPLSVPTSPPPATDLAL